MIAPSWRSLVQSWRQDWQHCRCVAISSLNSAGSSASTNAFRLLRTFAHRTALPPELNNILTNNLGNTPVEPRMIENNTATWRYGSGVPLSRNHLWTRAL